MSVETTYNGDVITEINNGIGVIEFDHPKSNSLPGKVLKKLANQLNRKVEKKLVREFVKS